MLTRRAPFRFMPGGLARRGLSLVEMLFVLTIIALLAAISLYAFRGVNSAVSLSAAAQRVVDELTLARETAVTMNEAVQVRFYEYPDATGASPASEFQALQSFGIKGTTTNALEKPEYLPAVIMIAPATQYSAPLGSQALVPPVASDPPLQVNGIGQNYKYGSVTFLANGSISPPTAAWFITLCDKRYLTTTPADFATVSLDPLTGRARLSQP